MACRPAVALTSVARALGVWSGKVKAAVKRGMDVESISSTLLELKLSADFVMEAAVDLVLMLAKVMALSVTAQRALWLKKWSADTASKQALCAIPFQGKLLFGKILDEDIQRVLGGKSGLIPQQ